MLIKTKDAIKFFKNKELYKVNKRANGALGIDVVKKHKCCDGIPYFIIRLHSFFGDDFISNVELFFHKGISMIYEGQRVKELTNKDFSSLDEIDKWAKKLFNEILKNECENYKKKIYNLKKLSFK